MPTGASSASSTNSYGLPSHFRTSDARPRKTCCRVRQRVYGVLADDADQDEHDEQRSDPVFKLLADRLPDDDDQVLLTFNQPTRGRPLTGMKPR